MFVPQHLSNIRSFHPSYTLFSFAVKCHSLDNQSTARKTTVTTMRLLKPPTSQRRVEMVEWAGINRKGTSNAQHLEDAPTKRSISKKGRILKPRGYETKEDLLAGIQEQSTKDGATPKELKTLLMLNDYLWTYEKEDRKLPTIHGRWIKAETDILKDMRRDHIHPRVIADRIGRKTNSVVNKITSLSDCFRECNETNHFEGPQSLPPDLEQLLLRSRLQNIWEGLMKSEVTHE